MAMKPPPVGRLTGGAGRTSVTPTAKPMPKPTLAGKKPLRVTGGNAPQTAGARSGVGRLAKNNAVANHRRMIDKRGMR